MRTPLRSAALLVAAALTLTGCSTLIPTEQETSGSSSQAETETGTEETTAGELDAAPATGATIAGDGYTFKAPTGWDDPQQEIPGFDPDSFAANLQDTDGFADNVNVLKSPVGVVTPDQVETLGLKELETVGATDVVVHDRVVVAGSESAHISAAMSSEGVSYVVDQYYVSSADQTYVVTFSFSDTVPAAERQQIAESVLVTWAWV
ncbi:hypothetical protein ACIQTT_06510 [Microbacterium sp. NPDC090225]|uniref:hypothetical protein n=1 Tax=Microbacterium sp. NPDC090225 TaxID=3364207 RepID=UPI00380092F4